MKYLFVILLVLLACSSTPTEEVRMEGIYDHADYERLATIIHFKDGRAIPMEWQFRIDCQTGDSITIVKVGTGTTAKTEIRIRRKKDG